MPSGTSLTVINGNSLAHLYRYYAIVNTFTRTHIRGVSFASSSKIIPVTVSLFYIIFILKLTYFEVVISRDICLLYHRRISKFY